MIKRVLFFTEILCQWLLHKVWYSNLTNLMIENRQNHYTIFKPKVNVINIKLFKTILLYFMTNNGSCILVLVLPNNKRTKTEYKQP